MIPSYQKAFKLGLYIPCEVGFHFMSSDPRVHAGDGATGSKSSTCSKCGLSGLKVSRSLYLDNHLSERVHTRTKCTL